MVKPQVGVKGQRREGWASHIMTTRKKSSDNFQNMSLNKNFHGISINRKNCIYYHTYFFYPFLPFSIFFIKPSYKVTNQFDFLVLQFLCNEGDKDKALGRKVFVRLTLSSLHKSSFL
jgi:hypothetical protein